MLFNLCLKTKGNKTKVAEMIGMTKVELYTQLPVVIVYKHSCIIGQIKTVESSFIRKYSCMIGYFLLF